ARRAKNRGGSAWLAHMEQGNRGGDFANSFESAGERGFWGGDEARDRDVSHDGRRGDDLVRVRGRDAGEMRGGGECGLGGGGDGRARGACQAGDGDWFAGISHNGAAAHLFSAG